MDAKTTLPPALAKEIDHFLQNLTLFPEVMTEIATKDDEDNEAMIGVIVGVVLLLLLLIFAIVALLLCLSRHKGSYITNEEDGYDNDEDDDESVGSDTALQSKEPLQIKEED